MLDEKLEQVELYLNSYEATDWEIVEEKKTLYDKRYYYGIKEALEEFLEALTEGEDEYSSVRTKAKEIFGEELVKENSTNKI